MAGGDAPAAVLGQIVPLPPGEGGVHLVQGGEQVDGQLRPAHRPPQGLGEGGGDGGEVGAEVGLGLAHIDPNTHHHGHRCGALGLELQLGENAAELFAVQDDVVGPLDAAGEAAAGLDGPAHRHRRPGGELTQGVQGDLGPEEDGTEEPLPLQGLEGVAPAAPARRLLVGEDSQALRGPVGRPALDLTVGGVHRVQADHLPAHQMAGEGGGQLPGAQVVGGTREPVTPVGGGDDLISRPAQGLHRLPHRRPAHTQPAAHLLPGAVHRRLGPQQGQDLILKHGPTSFPAHYTPYRPEWSTGEKKRFTNRRGCGTVNRTSKIVYDWSERP